MSAIEAAYRNALVGDAALLAAATGGVHQDVAVLDDDIPADAAVVVFRLNGPSDEATMDGRVVTSASYTVEGYARSAAAATTLAIRIQVVCSNPTLAGYHVIEAYRTGHISRRELDDAERLWWVEGGTYSLQVETL